MENEITPLDILITKSLSCNATPDEMAELTALIGQSTVNKKIFEDQKQIWEKSQAFFPHSEIISDREKIKDQIIKHYSGTSSPKILTHWFLRIAAIFMLPIMLAVGWYLGSARNNTAIQLCEVTTPKGQISKCVLADGTKVWLNAGTTIKYDPSLNGKTREVELEGEAYFNVAKNINKPFIVKTKNTQVKVLGTMFNVKAYPNDNSIETTLEEGSIEFTLIGSNAKPIVLKPNEQILYNPEAMQLTIGKVDTYLITAWKDGKYVFKDADLETIIKELERLYDVRIHLDNDSLRRLRFRGMFAYEQNIFSAMEALERTTNMKYSMKGRDITLK